MSSYVYILINPSLKGLLKIGMTNRSPEERALELSGSTNMPTPFSVAYEETVPNGYIAEQIIHEELAKNGFRVSDNREFFSIPLKTAIQVVGKVAEQLRNESTVPAENDNDEFGNDNIGEYYYLKGLNELNGSADTLQDHKAAYASLMRAADFNIVHSYYFLAHMHTLGLGVPQSVETVLSLLKKGGEKGDPSCYKAMWDIYAGNTILDCKNENNAEVCYRWMIEAAANGIDTAEEVLFGSLQDYLDHSYDRLDQYGEKFELSKFPGVHFQFVLEECSDRVKRCFQKIRESRIYGISLEELDEECRKTPSIPNFGEAIIFEYFLSNYVVGGKDILKKCMIGIEKIDLEYIFRRAKNPNGSVAEYMNYLTIEKPVQKKDLTDSGQNQKKGGIFGWLFS